ncbi:flavodoxin family protein [Aminipila luticellarii]|uniref:Flavodoxin family protein n=1 Tax=Aminipila luticellarii TaxID=2507160 RepID=A0A410PY67_9FIRM|nr:flavodoxin family protein [Aminipila luticellarii]QAT43790.1 flavodoxin family protein [Aminipila luticellarii]
MAITVVWSSPNKDGLTAAAKDRVITGILSAGYEAEEIHLNQMKMEHCRACGNGWGICRTKGQCIIKDDFAAVYEKLVQADGIVFVSAVYWHDITECMKAFLDRLRRCETARNGFLKDKRCLLIACAGGTGLGAVECLHNLEETLKHMNMRAYDRLTVIRYNKGYMLPTLEKAGETYAARLEDGFDMQY